jgi:hypothetical protein
VLALLELARRWSRPVSPFVGAPRGMRSVTWVEPRLEAEAENNLSSDVEVYKGYQIAYQTRKGAGIVRVTAYVTAQPLPVGRRPQRFAAEARDPVDARISARGQATYWIDNVAPA